MLVDEADLPLVSDYAWSKNVEDGYARAYVRGSKPHAWAFLHILLMRPEGGLTVDHINRDRLDNRRANLRNVTQAVNNENKDFNWARSGEKCVTAHPDGRFSVRVGKQYVGRFPTCTAAVEARDTFLRGRP